MVEMGRCVGFIEGVLAGDMIEARLYGVVSDKRLICMPPAVTVDQSIRVVVAFADHRPAETHRAFAAFILAAALDAWPCNDDGGFKKVK